LRDELVHHLHRAGYDASGDDVADGLTGVVHSFKHTEQRLVTLRRADEPDQHARDDAEHTFAPDDGTAQIVTVNVLAAVGRDAEPDDLAIRQDHLEAEDVIGGDAVFERVRATRVHGDVPADGASGLRRRIRRVEQTVRFYGISDPRIDAAGFDERAAVANVHRQHAIHPRQ
jgi:hypothetical protein